MWNCKKIRKCGSYGQDMLVKVLAWFLQPQPEQGDGTLAIDAYVVGVSRNVVSFGMVTEAEQFEPHEIAACSMIGAVIQGEVFLRSRLCTTSEQKIYIKAMKYVPHEFS